MEISKSRIEKAIKGESYSSGGLNIGHIKKYLEDQKCFSQEEINRIGRSRKKAINLLKQCLYPEKVTQVLTEIKATDQVILSYLEKDDIEKLADLPETKEIGQDDLVWKNLIIKDFSDRVDIINGKVDKNTFKTYKDFYEYIDYMKNNRVKVHTFYISEVIDEMESKLYREDEELVLSDKEYKSLEEKHSNLTGRYIQAEVLDDVVNEYNPEFLEKTKRGDIIEVSERIEGRMTGAYFVDEIKGIKTIIELNDYPDDYGTVPEDFSVITEFPIGYWHTNYSGQEDWHNNYIPFSPEKAGVKFTLSDLKSFELNSVKYHYIKFKYKGINYALVGGYYFPVEKLLKRFNGDSYYELETSEEVALIVGVPLDNILYTE